MKNEYFLNSTSEFSKVGIKIGRVDVAENSWFSNLHPDLRVLPNWVMYVKGKPYYFDSTKSFIRLMVTLRRFAFPYETIHSVRKFDELLEFTRIDQTGRILVRNKVFGLFHDKDEYDGEIEAFKNIAIQSYWREDTLFVLCIKQEGVAEIYDKYRNKFLPNQYDKNVIVNYRMKNRFDRADEIKVLTFDKSMEIMAWLSKSNITPLEEMHVLNQKSFSTQYPLLALFVDPKEEIITQSFLDDMRTLGTKYLGQVNFVWLDFRDNLRLMKRLGVEG